MRNELKFYRCSVVPIRPGRTPFGHIRDPLAVAACVLALCALPALL
jgi:hypothetical protein